MIEMWMEKHLTGDNNCNIKSKVPKLFNGTRNNVRFPISVGDTTWTIFDEY